MLQSILSALLLVLITSTLALAVPDLISYQGVLTDSAGVSISTSTPSLLFQLFDVETGGVPLWSETQSVTVIDGTYNVLLGSLQPLDPVLFVGERWLQVSVNGESLLPRRQLGRSSYALRSGQAAALTPGAIAGGSLAAGSITGAHIAGRGLTAQSFATACAEGEALVQTTSGWVCRAIQRLAQNDLQRCYTGPAATFNVGQCREGVRRWEGSTYSPCQAETLPTAEDCGDNLDNDCDGTVNNGCP